MLVTDVPVMTRGKFEFSATGMRVLRPASFEEWQAVGDWLRVLEKSVSWWIADWVRYGEMTYEEQSAQALSAREGEAAQATGWTPETIKQYSRIAAQVPPTSRDPDLTFSHHREVADLPPADQQVWLKRAKDEDWSCTRLRGELRTALKPEARCWLLVACKDAADRDTLMDSLRMAGREVKVP